VSSLASTYARAAPNSLFGWLVADGWCWFVLREEYRWLVADGWFVVREKYCWLVADKPSEQGASWPGGGMDLVASFFEFSSDVSGSEDTSWIDQGVILSMFRSL
jgi:hypothetical protein